MSPPRPATPATAESPARSFQQVYAECAPFVWRSLRRLGVRDADLEDVCQEAFVVVHRRLPELDGSASPRTWLLNALASTTTCGAGIKKGGLSKMCRSPQ